MVDYPENYKKPTLVEYLANEVLESCTEPENWDMCDLGEKIAVDHHDGAGIFHAEDKLGIVLLDLDDIYFVKTFF